VYGTHTNRSSRKSKQRVWGKRMIIPKLKSFEESIRYDYPVCEIEECIEEAKILAMTETKYVDFCEKHHREYIVAGR
jgi:hypothetical protein